MKIALLGYGRMGKAIERIAIQRGHEIKLKVNTRQDAFDLKDIDIAIDFSLPNAAFDNIYTCLDQGTPVISGTTGWLDRYDDITTFCKEKGGSFIYASNFSLGVNLFFELNRKLTELMKGYSDYKVSIEEIHHTQKLDAPSGTAISLAAPILEKFNMDKWVLGVTNKENELPIETKRIDDVFGIHKIKYRSEIDEITIEHQANSRDGFALGAVVAAEWLLGKKGVFTMKDVIENT